jgi:hypothetical protein
MRRRFSLAAALSLALLFSLPAPAQDSPSPSLGDIARQAQKDKDKANKPAAKVFTNEDMPSGPGGGTAALGGGLGQAAQALQGNASNANLTPSQKLDQIGNFLNQVESLDKTTLVQGVLGDKKDVNFPGRARWEERLYAAKETYVAQVRTVIDKARQIVSAADSLKGTRDPNDPRVKEMSARLETLMREAVQTDSGFQAVVMEGRDLAAQPNSH